MNVLDLFSGIGGFSLGLESTGHFRTVAFCEIESFCQKVLRKHWPDVPIYGDIRELDGRQFRDIDLISAGVPCQPASCAGKRRGTSDDRWLWGEAFRIVREVHPAWCIFENVRGLLTLEHGLVFEKLLSDLEGEGYETQPFIIPACGLNAPHRRDRVWILGRRQDVNDPESRRCGILYTKNIRQNTREINAFADPDCHAPDTASVRWRVWPCGNLDDNTNQSSQCYRGEGKATRREYCPCGTWKEPWLEVATRLCGISHGVPNRVDRLKCLGNAVVPQIVAILGEAIWKTQMVAGVTARMTV